MRALAQAKQRVKSPDSMDDDELKAELDANGVACALPVFRSHMINALVKLRADLASSPSSVDDAPDRARPLASPVKEEATERRLTALEGALQTAVLALQEERADVASLRAEVCALSEHLQNAFGVELSDP